MTRFKHTIKIRGGTYPVRSVHLYQNMEYRVDGLILDREDVYEEVLEEVKENLFSKLKIIESPSVPKDTLLILAPLTDDEQKQCYGIEDVIRILLEKKKVAIMENIK